MTGNNHFTFYILLAIIGILLVFITSFVYSMGSELKEIMVEFREQTERTHSDITNRLAILQQQS